jgi:sRNA-binding protein
VDHEIDIRGIIALLAERFPRTFFVVGKNRKPLKVGIYYDLVADLRDEVSERALSLTLYYYTNEVGYLKSTKQDRPRFDLNGDVAGKVTDEEELYARGRLAETIAKLKRAAGGSS